MCLETGSLLSLLCWNSLEEGLLLFLPMPRSKKENQLQRKGVQATERNQRMAQDPLLSMKRG